MAKSTRKTADPLLFPNETEEMRNRREHAMEFPPNTPHSVINHFYEKEHPTDLPTHADPRKLKSERVGGIDVVESAPGVASAPESAVDRVEALAAPLPPPRRARARKSRKAAKSTSETLTKEEAAKV